jgi:hypothetical protein
MDVEEETKRLADLKEWIDSRINELEIEIVNLREMLLIVDKLLRETSFKSASELIFPIPKALSKMEKIDLNGQNQEVQDLKRLNDGRFLGKALISDSKLIVIPSEDLNLNIEAAPFKSFFINRILEGMKKKDINSVNNQELKPSKILNFIIEEDNGLIKKIIIENYNQKTRLSEILNTLIWAFTRMLEKSKKTY